MIWFHDLINKYPLFTHMVSLSCRVTLNILCNLPFSLKKVIYSLHWHSIFSSIYSWIDRIDDSKFSKPCNICIFRMIQVNISRVEYMRSILDAMIKNFEKYLEMYFWKENTVHTKLRTTWWAKTLRIFASFFLFYDLLEIFFNLPVFRIKFSTCIWILQKLFAFLECSFEHPVSLTRFGIWDDFERIHTI